MAPHQADDTSVECPNLEGGVNTSGQIGKDRHVVDHFDHTARLHTEVCEKDGIAVVDEAGYKPVALVILSPNSWCPESLGDGAASFAEIREEAVIRLVHDHEWSLVTPNEEAEEIEVVKDRPFIDQGLFFRIHLVNRGRATIQPQELIPLK